MGTIYPHETARRTFITRSMMTSSNKNIFRVTDPLCGEFTGHRWIPRTKASVAELWCFLWFAHWINCWVNNREAGDLRRHCAHYEIIVMFTSWTVVSGQTDILCAGGPSSWKWCGELIDFSHCSNRSWWNLCVFTVVLEWWNRNCCILLNNRCKKETKETRCR